MIHKILPAILGILLFAALLFAYSHISENRVRFMEKKDSIERIQARKDSIEREFATMKEKQYYDSLEQILKTQNQ